MIMITIVNRVNVDEAKYIMLTKSQSGSQWCEEKFKLCAYKLTKPRRIILQVLNKTSQHLSAEDIYMAVHKKYPNIGLTTIYRTLDLLICMGMITKSDFGDKRARYELAIKDGNVRRHHHLVCTKCHKVVDYTDSSKEENELLAKIGSRLAKKYDFKISSRFIQFCGLCNSCENEVK
jgi:Fur family ferric uptake transcriptional regulator